jgi:hypothetical protein
MSVFGIAVFGIAVFGIAAFGIAVFGIGGCDLFGHPPNKNPSTDLSEILHS